MGLIRELLAHFSSAITRSSAFQTRPAGSADRDPSFSVAMVPMRSRKTSVHLCLERRIHVDLPLVFSRKVLISPSSSLTAMVLLIKVR
jgi:hypothetical protein